MGSKSRYNRAVKAGRRQVGDGAAAAASAANNGDSQVPTSSSPPLAREEGAAAPDGVSAVPIVVVEPERHPCSEDVWCALAGAVPGIIKGVLDMWRRQASKFSAEHRNRKNVDIDVRADTETKFERIRHAYINKEFRACTGFESDHPDLKGMLAALLGLASQPKYFDTRQNMLSCPQSLRRVCLGNLSDTAGAGGVMKHPVVSQEDHDALHAAGCCPYVHPDELTEPYFVNGTNRSSHSLLCIMPGSQEVFTVLRVPKAGGWQKFQLRHLTGSGGDNDELLRMFTGEVGQQLEWEKRDDSTLHLLPFVQRLGYRLTQALSPVAGFFNLSSLQVAVAGRLGRGEGCASYIEVAEQKEQESSYLESNIHDTSMWNDSNALTLCLLCPAHPFAAVLASLPDECCRDILFALSDGGTSPTLGFLLKVITSVPHLATFPLVLKCIELETVFGLSTVAADHSFVLSAFHSIDVASPAYKHLFPRIQAMVANSHSGFVCQALDSLESAFGNFPVDQCTSDRMLAHILETPPTASFPSVSASASTSPLPVANDDAAMAHHMERVRIRSERNAAIESEEVRLRLDGFPTLPMAEAAAAPDATPPSPAAVAVDTAPSPSLLK